VDESGRVLAKAAVENLLYAVDRAQTKGIVAIEDIQECDYVVDVSYESRGKELGGFRFAGAKNGDFVYEMGADKAFGLEIPGFESLSLRKVFSDRGNSYQQRLLMDYLPSEISYVKLRDLKGREFSLTQDKQAQLIVKDADGALMDAYDEHKVRLLLSYFNGIVYERVLGVDDQVSAESIAAFEVRSFDGERHSLTVVEYLNEEGEADMYRAAVRYNRGKDLLLIKWWYIELIVAGLACGS